MTPEFFLLTADAILVAFLIATQVAVRRLPEHKNE